MAAAVGAGYLDIFNPDLPPLFLRHVPLLGQGSYSYGVKYSYNDAGYRINSRLICAEARSSHAEAAAGAVPVSRALEAWKS